MMVMLVWWHLPLGYASLWLGALLVLCAYHWPRSRASGVEFGRDIVIPALYALLAGLALVAGYALLSAR